MNKGIPIYGGRGGLRPCLAILGAFMLLGACTVSGAVEKVTSVVVKPIFGLVVKDAKTTLEWIEREVEAGRLALTDVNPARRCPEAVLALDELRTKMTQATKPDGFKGVIYYGTLNRFGQGAQAEAGKHMSQLARECLPLIPVEKLIKLF